MAEHQQHQPASDGVGRGQPLDEPHTQAEPDDVAIAAALEQARRGIAGELGAAHSGRSVTDQPAP